VTLLLGYLILIVLHDHPPQFAGNTPIFIFKDQGIIILDCREHNTNLPGPRITFILSGLFSGKTTSTERSLQPFAAQNHFPATGNHRLRIRFISCYSGFINPNSEARGKK
jgi:hypothetical protein